MAESTGDKIAVIFMFILVFTAIYIGLTALVPVELVYSGSGLTGQTIPSYFTRSDIEAYKYYQTHNLIYQSATAFDFRPNGTQFYIDVFFDGYSPATDYISIRHLTGWFLWWPIHEPMYPTQLQTNSYYPDIRKADVLAKWDATKNATIFYPVQCDHLTVKVWMIDQNQTRNNIGQAWDAHQLRMTIAFGVDTLSTTLSSWDIVARLLSFQAFTFGLNPLAALLASVMNLLFFAGIAYVIYRIVLMAIPFL